MQNNKNLIRKKMKLLLRKNYAVDESGAWTASRLFFSKFNQIAEKIALYWPMIYELDTRPLIKNLIEKNINISLPTLLNNNLVFKKWDHEIELKCNHLKFYEPLKNSEEIKPNVVLVPLLAFDNLGYRLGYGKGLYDRYYEKNKNITYIGYGYDFQNVTSLPIKDYDLKLNYVVTNNYIKKFN